MPARKVHLNTLFSWQTRSASFRWDFAGPLQPRRDYKESALLSSLTPSWISRTSIEAYPAGNLATFIEVNVVAGAINCILLESDNPSVSFASRTSSLNPPKQKHCLLRASCGFGMKRS